VRTTLFVVGVLILVGGCGKDSVTDTGQRVPYPINLNFQFGFDHDSAVVSLDRGMIASVDSITTNPILVLAASRRFMILPGMHILSVWIPSDTVRTDTTFVHVEKELWIGIDYDRNARMIRYIIQYTPFGYR
jgi:hypothetical protein